VTDGEDGKGGRKGWGGGTCSMSSGGIDATDNSWPLNCTHDSDTALSIAPNALYRQ